MSSSSVPTPVGPGSATGAPNLPADFTDMFASRFVDAGQVRLHAVVGGSGPPLLLVHGWPQTWYAWRMLMPALARDFTVIAVDQRGIGLSDKPADGYDLGSQAEDLAGAMDALGHRRFAVYGTDTGFPIAYALAADHPDRVERLVVSEAFLPGITPPYPLVLPAARNERLWHIAFNRCAEVNERLVRGREDVYFGNEYAQAAVTKLPDDVIAYYVEMLRSDEHSLRGSFGWYRALDAGIAQNQERVSRRLTLPVLAIGAEYSSGESVGVTMRLVADDVQALVIPGVGHRVAEEAPEEQLAALTSFLAPYRDGAAAVVPRPRPAGTYHDDSTWPHLELGPQDDRRYFEQLVKAIFQAGLSWPTIEAHWPAFADVFHDFDPVAVAAMTDEDVERAVEDPRIIRNHRKVHAAVASAAAFDDVVARHGSFDAYLRSFPSPEDALTDVKKRFAGLGDYSAWWFLQSVGQPVPTG